MENKSNFCEHCGEKLEKNEQFCSKCGKKIGGEAKDQAITNNNKEKKKMPVWAIVLIVIFSLFVIGALFSDNEELSSEQNNNELYTETNAQITTEKKEQKQNNTIQYQKVSIDDIEQELEENAAAAKDKYNNKYLEISGKLGTIDSDLKYIALVSETNEFDLTGVHCTIKNDKQREIIKTLKSNQKIIVKGKITDVGEVLGYFLDITEINVR